MPTTLAARIAELGLAEVAVALHTADPGSDMATTEVSYGGYERTTVTLPPPRCIDFPRGAGPWDGDVCVTHYSVGPVDGSSKILFSGELLVPVAIGDGDMPHLWTER